MLVVFLKEKQRAGILLWSWSENWKLEYIVSLTRTLSSVNLMDLAQIVFILFQFENGHGDSAIKNRAKNVHFLLYFTIFH